jgi:hypothetical protein
MHHSARVRQGQIRQRGEYDGRTKRPLQGKALTLPNNPTFDAKPKVSAVLRITSAI